MRHVFRKPKPPVRNLHGAKGQSSIMEYLLMSFFMLLVIVVLIFFLGWWQFTQFHMEGQKSEFQRADSLVNRLISSPVLVRENSVFDDSSLTALKSLGTAGCREMDRLFGRGWSMEIEIIDPDPGCSGECDELSYPCCGYWSICPPESEPESMMIRVLPVNVYRRPDGRTDLAVLRAGAYS